MWYELWLVVGFGRSLTVRPKRLDGWCSGDLARRMAFPAVNVPETGSPMSLNLPPETDQRIKLRDLYTVEHFT